MSIKIKIMLFYICLALLNSCKIDSSNAVDTSKFEHVNIQEINKHVTDIVYPLPTTFEITKVLNKNNISYILSLSNPISNAEKYFTQKQKAINLGIYGSDLCYAISYNQKQIAVDYLRVSNQLIDELNFSHIINSEVLNQLQLHKNNKDEIINIISNTLFDTYKFLNNEQRGEVAAQIITGSWIESLYIATHILKDTYTKPDLVQLISQQKESLNKLLNIYKNFNNDESIKELETSILKIYTAYNDEKLTKEELNKITIEIEQLRQTYIQ